jgi:hypothetical protein
LVACFDHWYQSAVMAVTEIMDIADDPYATDAKTAAWL